MDPMELHLVAPPKKKWYVITHRQAWLILCAITGGFIIACFMLWNASLEAKINRLQDQMAVVQLSLYGGVVGTTSVVGVVPIITTLMNPAIHVLPSIAELNAIIAAKNATTTQK